MDDNNILMKSKSHLTWVNIGFMSVGSHLTELVLELLTLIWLTQYLMQFSHTKINANNFILVFCCHKCSHTGVC